MTSAEPPAGPAADLAAFCDALAIEHSVIYGYGLVSAHSPPELNNLVALAIHQHRDRRDRVIALLAGRSVSAPVAAAGYQLPVAVTDATDAAQLAVRLEDNTAVAWRAVVEQAGEPADRQFATAALAHSAVLAARWNQVLGAWPITRAFPGGAD